MATQITTVREILDELNGAGKDEPWAVMPDVYFLTQAVVTNNGTSDLVGNGLVMKGFINKKTGEVKTYLAKWLDIPEATLLP